MREEDLVETIEEATAQPPWCVCQTCGRTCTLIVRQVYSWARNDFDYGLGPGCVWCDVTLYTFGAWTGSRWETWEPTRVLPPRMTHIRSFLRVAAEERPEALLPSEEDAARLWTEVFQQAYADATYTRHWTLLVLNPHLTLYDVRRYLAAVPSASPVVTLPDPLPASEDLGHHHLELGRERDALRSDALRIGPWLEDEKHVTASDGSRWVAYRMRVAEVRVGKLPVGDRSGSWLVPLDSAIPPASQPGRKAPSLQDHEQLATYLREFDPITHAYLVDAWNFISENHYREDVLMPASSVRQRIEELRASRERLLSRIDASDDRELRASLVDPIALAREAARFEAALPSWLTGREAVTRPLQPAPAPRSWWRRGG
jgi:hypothetical protein